MPLLRKTPPPENKEQGWRAEDHRLSETERKLVKEAEREHTAGKTIPLSELKKKHGWRDD